jgi:predicted CopG family antitoxin
MCNYTHMKTVRVKETIWERLQKLKLKWRKRNIGEVIEQLLPEEEAEK